jgi:hypothetical protein
MADDYTNQLIIANYTNQLDIANADLEKELERVKNEANTNERVNEYSQQDDIMLIYMQKILTVLYAIIYIAMVYMLYVNPTTSKLYLGIMALLFFLLPATFWLIGKYFSDTMLKAVKMFIKGNANYLYV